MPAGTVHAIGSGILILETQQSSDTTYRIYDYDRKDKHGHLRDLHLEQSKAVININQENPNMVPQKSEVQGQTVTQFVSNEFFTVEKWEINSKLNYNKPHAYCLVTIIDGTGTLTVNDKHYDIQKGSSFILTTEDEEIHFVGNISAIVSHPG